MKRLTIGDIAGTMAFLIAMVFPLVAAPVAQAQHNWPEATGIDSDGQEHRGDIRTSDGVTAWLNYLKYGGEPTCNPQTLEELMRPICP